MTEMPRAQLPDRGVAGYACVLVWPIARGLGLSLPAASTHGHAGLHACCRPQGHKVPEADHPRSEKKSLPQTIVLDQTPRILL